MTALASLLAVLFALLAGFLGIVAQRGMRGEIPFGGPVGLPGPRVRASQGAWDRAHRAAAPYVGAAAAISLLQLLGCAMALAVPGLLSGGYLALLAGSGILLITLLLVLAARMGERAAR